MTEKFEPVFLQNSPSVICDQILYLVKNLNLNFEVHETPFSLNINLKKRFAHHWNRPNQSAAHNSEVHVPQHVSDPVHGHSPHYPSDGQPGQPGQLSASQTKDSLQFHNKQHHPQHRSYSPQHHALVPQVQVSQHLVSSSSSNRPTIRRLSLIQFSKIFRKLKLKIWRFTRNMLNLKRLTENSPRNIKNCKPRTLKFARR